MKRFTLFLSAFVLFSFSGVVLAKNKKKPTTRSVKKKAKVKKKKRYLHFTHRPVPVSKRPYRQWGFVVGVQGAAGTGRLSGVFLGTSFGGYYCMKGGHVCFEAVPQITFLPPVIYGGSPRVSWFPWSNKSWLYLGVGASFLGVQADRFQGQRFTGDLHVGILWRAFSDLAPTAMRIELVASAGADVFIPYPFAPSTSQFVFTAGLRVYFDFALRQVYADGKSLSAFTGRSNYNPRDSVGIYQNLQPHVNLRVRRRGQWIIYRGLRLRALGDADRDGILNVVDKCPLHRGPAQFKGCPPSLDSDGDRLEDWRDRRPLNPRIR